MVLHTFIYSWTSSDEEIEDENEHFMIRGFGRTEDLQDVVVEIIDFPLYFYIELPSHIDWKKSRMMVHHFQTKLMELFERNRIQPEKMALLYKKKLYYYTETEYPFLFVAFSKHADRLLASRILIKNDTFLVFGKKIKTRCHEYEASGILQFLCFRNVPSCGWVEIKQFEEVKNNSYCDKTIRVSYRDIHSVEKNTVPSFNVFAFDIEVYSDDHAKMPMAENKTDQVFQISLVGYQHKILLTLGEVCTNAFQVYQFQTEKELLLAFSKMIRSLRVHVLIGYNIFGFDIPYLLDRAKLHGIYNAFTVQGMMKNQICQEKKISWTSSAYRNQEFRYLDVIGRIVIDLLPMIKRDYKLSNYKLSTVSQHFLGADKDPVKPKDIFEFYKRFLMKKDDFSIQLLTIIGEYCIKDSQLVLDLFEKLQSWIGLIEMAKICNVPIPVLYTQGQQIKVYSQIYKHCLYQKIVVESSMYHKNTNTEQYTGAFVFDPSPGVYDNIIPFDFAALYPTTIIAYNIDFSTLVTDRNIPDEDCHIVEWAENNTKFRFRFIKKVKGVIPRMLEDLLSQRKMTKSSMKSHDKNSLVHVVLDKRQLALKVSANSAYGIMGATKGYLPFLPGAMSTTAMGRQSIMKAAEYVKSTYQGKLIYGDSVCDYTPVILRINKTLIRILPIEEIAYVYGTNGKYWQTDHQGKEFFELDFIYIETWTDKGWSRLYRVIRHELCPSKSIWRVFTQNGDIVDVTSDHSLIRGNGEIVTPQNINIGIDNLLTNHFPDVEYQNETVQKKTEIEAYVYGQCYSCCIPDWILNIHDNRILIAFWNGVCRGQDPQYRTMSTNTIDPNVILRFNAQTDCQKALFVLSKIGSYTGVIEHNYNHYTFKIKVIQTLNSVVSRIELISSYRGMVYDLTTENHHFSAGIGRLIVHNTDSIYCHFPSIPNEQLWSFAVQVENEFTTLFPKPMKLAFEEKIYKRFLIFTKKRYMAFTQNKDFSIDKELTVRGVLLARRDNCKWIRNIYEKVVRILMNLEHNHHTDASYIEYIIQEEMIKLCSHYYDSSFITVTKTVGSDYKEKVVTGYDEKTGKITDVSKWKKRLAELEISIHDKNWLESYKLKMMPAHVQLAKKMTTRGNPVSSGTRIEYLMVQHPNPKAKQFLKIEDPEYQSEYSDVLKLDYLYVLGLAKNSLHQLISVVFPESDMISKLIELHTKKTAIMQEIRNLFCSRILFQNS